MSLFKFLSSFSSTLHLLFILDLRKGHTFYMTWASHLGKKGMTCLFGQETEYFGSVSVLVNYDLCFTEINSLNIVLEMKVESDPFLIGSGCFMFYHTRISRQTLPFKLLMQAKFENKVSLRIVLYPVIITKYLKIYISFKIIFRFSNIFKRIFSFLWTFLISYNHENTSK